MFRVINKYGKGTVVQTARVLVPVYHVVCWRVFWSGIFQTFIQSPSSETVISAIHRLWGSSFFSKFNVDLKNQHKNREKEFCFWDNMIWIGCLKLSLLRRKYLSLAVNVLANSLKILHSTDIDFFQLNYVHSDQKIW